MEPAGREQLKMNALMCHSNLINQEKTRLLKREKCMGITGKTRAAAELVWLAALLCEAPFTLINPKKNNGQVKINEGLAALA